MEVKQQAKLSFKGVDIINLNFNAISPVNENVNIQITCVPKVFYPDNCYNEFKILMDIELKDEKFFILILRAIGSFELDTEITPELNAHFVNVNAPAIMFPYIRSFITTLTANLGNPTGSLVIPPQFFSGNLEVLPKE